MSDGDNQANVNVLLIEFKTHGNLVNSTFDFPLQDQPNKQILYLGHVNIQLLHQK